MAAALTPRQARFVQEYLVDQIGAQAARRAGYSGKSTRSIETQAARLLSNAGVRLAIDCELEARRKKYHLDADRVVEHLGKIIAVDPRSYVDANGETLPLNQLTEAQAQAIASFETETFVDKDGQTRVRTKVKLNDRNVALGTSSKILGLQTDRLRVASSM